MQRLGNIGAAPETRIMNRNAERDFSGPESGETALRPITKFDSGSDE
jgi:hypothetical protein